MTKHINGMNTNLARFFGARIGYKITWVNSQDDTYVDIKEDILTGVSLDSNTFLIELDEISFNVKPQLIAIPLSKIHVEDELIIKTGLMSGIKNLVISANELLINEKYIEDRYFTPNNEYGRVLACEREYQYEGSFQNKI